jgi:hypothetical protein
VNAAHVAGAALALVFAPLGHRGIAPAHPHAAAPVSRVAPTVVIERYVAALHKLETPTAQSFDYTVEQLGLQNMEQTHHVYLSGRRERDETTIVDGYTLTRPSVRIIADRNNPYDVAAIAPRPSAYSFLYRGAVVNGAHVLYVFKTVPLAPSGFAVSEVDIDGTHFLPSRIYFKLAGEVARGSGVLAYGPSDRYWVVRDAQINAHLTNGTTAHEHIAWGGYSFPTELPPSTFDTPNTHAVELTMPVADSAPSAISSGP